MLSVQDVAGRELIDFEESKAFAVTDYQIAHVYCRDDAADEATHLLSSTKGVQSVLGPERARDLGIRHARSGDLIVLSEPEYWFSYIWWYDDELAPTFPRQGSHAKPGCDPLELFIKPGPGFMDMPTDTSLVRGSHGLTPDFGGPSGVILCDGLAAHELRINRVFQTEVFSMLGHLLR
jgi:hypothetical protein